MNNPISNLSFLGNQGNQSNIVKTFYLKALWVWCASSILVASFISNHENHLFSLCCGDFLVTATLKVIKKVIKELGSSEIGNSVDNDCLIFYGFSVPVIVLLRYRNIRMSHLVFDRSLIHTIIKKYRIISRSYLMRRLFVYASLLTN